jgi:hypothetical protein
MIISVLNFMITILLPDNFLTAWLGASLRVSETDQSNECLVAESMTAILLERTPIPTIVNRKQYAYPPPPVPGGELWVKYNPVSVRKGFLTPHETTYPPDVRTGLDCDVVAVVTCPQ